MTLESEDRNYPFIVGILDPQINDQGNFVTEYHLFLVLSKREFIHLEKGALWNGASIPILLIFLGWLLDLIFGNILKIKVFDDSYNDATAFHDGLVGEGDQKKSRLYTCDFDIVDFSSENLLKLTKVCESREMSWEESAQIFELVMHMGNTPEWKQWAYYEGVMLKKRPKHWAKKLFGA